MKNGQDSLTLQELYVQSLPKIKEGIIVTGEIISIGANDVLVDVGYKSEGLIPIAEFLPEERQIGKKVEVFVQAVESEDGTISLSREKAKKLKGWESIQTQANEGQFIKGKVRRKVKGGFIVDISGIEAFLPASLSMFKNMPDKDVLNKEFIFKLLKVNNYRKTLIVSRCEALQREKQERKEKLWESLEIGQIRTGNVKGIADFGVFIDLGGIDGLLHITDMSWSKINHPSEMVAIGDKIDVVVLNIDRKKQKVSLGLKQRLPDPWSDIQTKYPLGSKTKGKVVNILPYGIFVELEKGIEGLVHISEISWAKKNINLSEIFAVQDAVEVSILNIDKENRRIALSIKQLEANPWLQAKEKYPIGSKVTGKIKGFTDYGAFVELDSNLEGMIHISDISWTKRISHPQNVLKKGQRIEMVVLSVDPENQKISLGLKQLTENPWPEIAKRYPVGKILEVKVSNITDFGVFVKIEEDLEGLIYSSEIDKEILNSLNQGDEITAKIIKVDVEQAKIGLSARLE